MILFETKKIFFLAEINLIFTSKTFIKGYVPDAMRLIARIRMMTYVIFGGNFIPQSTGV